MVFDPQTESVRTPTRIRMLRIELFRSVDDDDPEYPQGMKFNLKVDDQNNTTMKQPHGDLAVHLEPAEIAAGLAFFNAVWAKAEAEILP